MGNCLMAGQGQAPARQAVRRRRPAADSAGAVTLSKMCGSGMRAMMFAHDMLKAEQRRRHGRRRHGEHDQRAAPDASRARACKYGAAQLYDHMALDGLEDAYERGKAMGVFAEDCVAKYDFTREAQDAFAIASTERAQDGQRGRQLRLGDRAGHAARQGGDTVIKFDEQPFKAKLDKIPGLKPAFKKDGTITAATSSSISDGAAALVLMRESTAKQLGCKPIARIVAHAVHAQAPDWFTTAPVGAIDKVLKKTGWTAKDVDLWEVNEAFAAVTMAAMDEFKLPHEIVNVHGGAVRAGPPDRRERRAHRRHAARRAAQARQEGASRRCASAAARRRRWRSSCFDATSPIRPNLPWWRVGESFGDHGALHGRRDFGVRAAVSDLNPLHHDALVAARSPFGEVIASGRTPRRS